MDRMRENTQEIGTPAAVGAFALSLGLLGASLLWLRYGEAIYFERLLSMIANCI